MENPTVPHAALGPVREGFPRARCPHFCVGKLERSSMDSNCNHFRDFAQTSFRSVLVDFARHFWGGLGLGRFEVGSPL